MLDENTVRNLLWLLILLPFLSGSAWLLAGRRINGWVGSAAAVLTLTGLGLSIWLTTQTGSDLLTLRTDWLAIPGRSVPITFHVDPLTLLMLVIVHFIALLVQIYSISYLHDEQDRYRYFGFLSLFIGSMLGIVLAGNLIIMYAFWELVGLSSYLLIGFWFRKPEAAAAAKKAFIMNRIGDAGFLLGIFLLLFQSGTTDLTELPDLFVSDGRLATLTGLCLFCGCIGKSAQFPLTTWLPDAMEGPTPVSALIHAATMVAAGIFLLARIHFLLTPDALLIITLIGTITMLMAAYSALYQTDIKKVLAYSTVSQLGLMVIGMGTGNAVGALFHLTTHAFFKAGLFLAAGSVIHGVHTQDMRRMGGLRKAMPLTFVGWAICSAALAGLPLFSGFLSKETILTGAFQWAGQQGNWAYLIPVLAVLSSGLTACYMARQGRLVFFGETRHAEAGHHSPAHESGLMLTVPILLLAALSIGFVFAGNPFSAGHSWFFRVFPSQGEPEEHLWIAVLSVTVAALGIWLGWRMPVVPDSTTHSRLSEHNWYLDGFYKRSIVRPFVQFSRFSYRFDQRVVDRVVNLIGMGNVVLAHIVGWIDRNIVDGLVNGASWLAHRLGSLTRSVQNGRVQSYIASAVIGLLLILWFLM
ncbi:NADH-quinone oxidoreductase subunit L [Larkinella arboricola]|uniref:NADH-quinone oxidoreductase subunit L n=1 Tax=Larkinella arboricola TaxID=643671 RepID=A0A327X9Z6_LARAB|nr:NADH-quinone oxidoreductase subunit L [Larkinella arboricola]RAK02452.1 NADH-quinone oxidoreductase subunit L [Larkinella arboricola]